MRTIKYHIETGIAHGVSASGEFEVDDGATDEQIEDMARERAFEDFGLSWSYWDAADEENGEE